MQITITFNQLVLFLFCGALTAILLYALFIYGRMQKLLKAISELSSPHTERLAQVKAQMADVAADVDFINGHLSGQSPCRPIEEEMSIIDSFRQFHRALRLSGGGRFFRKKRKGFLRRRRSFLSSLLRQWR